MPASGWRADLHDLAGSCVRFGRLLRERGVRVAPEQARRWLQSLALLGCRQPQDLYWSGRLTLISSPAHLDLYDELFRQFWLKLDHAALDPLAGRQQPGLPKTRGAQAPLAARDAGGDSEGAGYGQVEAPPAGLQAWLARYCPPPAQQGTAEPDRGQAEQPALQAVYSPLEILRDKDFAAYGEADRQELLALLQRAGQWWAPRLRSRRTGPARCGNRPDLRRTLAASARLGGDPVRLYWRQRRLHWRRWVFLLDISGSMASYTDAMLLFLHAVAARRPATEVFLFGTRLTRITPQLRRAPAGRLDAYLKEVRDWHGGTRLGAALRQFNRQYGRRGMAHGALVVVLSDGLDQGEAAEAGAELARLKQVAQRIAWVNPLKRSPRYEPLAGAMRAALPYIDDFVSGHNLASLVDLLTRAGAAPP